MASIEKDPKKTLRLAKKLGNENWKFRSWLKFNAPDNIDEIVSGLSRKYFSLIDCRECGNCCRAFSAIHVCKSEIATMAEAKGMPYSEFETKHVVGADERDALKVKLPCPMLKGNLCSIYSTRPKTCQEFPNLEKPDFVRRLWQVVENTAICPIVFNVYEELKTVLSWRKRRKVRTGTLQ